MARISFYKKSSANAITCTACLHYCTIPKGAFGLCGARKNEKNKIKLITHSRPCSLHLDPVEKKPLYHYLPGSKTMSIGFFGCNFKCDFCQNFDIACLRGSTAEKEIIKLPETSPQNFVEIAQKQNAKSIAFTYNEPSISAEYNLEAIFLAKKVLPALGTIYVSNGYTSAEQIKALIKGKAKLDAINIDLKSFSEDFYRGICGASLENVLKCIKEFHKAGIWMELTTLIIPQKNDSIEELKQIASWISGLNKNIPWHVSAFFPMHKMGHLPPTSFEKIKEAVKIGKDAGLNFVYAGNIHNHTELENTFCPKCGSLLIRRSGFDSGIAGLKSGKCTSCGEKVKGVFE